MLGSLTTCIKAEALPKIFSQPWRKCLENEQLIILTVQTILSYSIISFRDIPKESLKCSPFELTYWRKVKRSFNSN